ncbi:MAG: ornithine cyclodeaminase family protein [Chloroflexota bacterium]
MTEVAAVALLLTRAQVAELLDVKSVIDVVERGFADHASEKVQMPQRTAVRMTDPPGTLLLMPAAMMETRVLGTKLVSVYGQNPSRGLPTIGALYVLSDFDTGFPLAVMDAGYMTGLRTAAASAVATKYMARKDARTLGVFGTGVQGLFHVLAIPAVRDIQRIVVTGRDRAKTEKFAADMQQRLGIAVEATDSVAAAAGCDIVVAGTTATTPLFPASMLAAGAHINGVGSHAPGVRELGSDIVGRCGTIVVDTHDAARAEAGDLQMAIEEGVITWDSVAGTVGDVVLGRVPGRRSEGEITLFKSQGVAFQDAVTAALAYERAKAAGVGTEFAFS